MKKIGIISLGCDKNRVDSEKMLFALEEGGYALTQDVREADVIIINTCAFIGDAKKESIDTILEMAELKKTSKKYIVVTGCFSTRYAQEIKEDLPEVDVFLPIKEEYKILSVVNGFFGKGEEEGKEGRVLTTPYSYAYLKIADGCNNRCSYCAIPFIRGKYVSEPIEKLVQESEILYKEGVKELILVAQDVTNYGRDLYGKPSLIDLLKELSKIDFWKIRILYAYPELIDDELIDYICQNDKIAKYLDVPLQHVSNDVLKKMNRRSNRESIDELVDKIRKKDVYVALRSTFINGFPQETEEDHENLKEFLENKLDYAGFFVYSPEEGTKAYEMDGRVKKGVAKKRRTECEKVQVKATLSAHERLVGKELEVIYEGIDYNKGKFYGRSEYQAPEIDVKIYFSSKYPLEIGEIYRVKITKAGFYPEGETI